MKSRMEKIQPPIVHADYDDYDEEQLDEMINLMIQKTQSLYTCTVLKLNLNFSRSSFLIFSSSPLSISLNRHVASQPLGKAWESDKT